MKPPVLVIILFLLLSAPVVAQGSTSPQGYYVDVVSGSDTNPGTSSSPFRTIKKAVAVTSPRDVVHVAPGYYSESTGEDFSGAGIGGYLVKEEVQFRFWDIGNDLPHVHPGQVVLKTEGDKASAFVFEDIGDPAQSGLRFARTFHGPPAETLKLLRLEGFTETAIRVLGSRDGPKLAGDALLLTGIEWVDCDAALFIEADGRNTQLGVEIRNSLVNLPSLAGVAGSALLEGDKPAVEISALDQGQVAVKLDRTSILISDREHPTSVITFLASKHLDPDQFGGVAPPALFEIENSRVGLEPSQTTPIVQGAGIEIATVLGGGSRFCND